MPTIGRPTAAYLDSLYEGIELGKSALAGLAEGKNTEASKLSRSAKNPKSQLIETLLDGINDIKKFASAKHHGAPSRDLLDKADFIIYNLNHRLKPDALPLFQTSHLDADDGTITFTATVGNKQLFRLPGIPNPSRRPSPAESTTISLAATTVQQTRSDSLRSASPASTTDPGFDTDSDLDYDDVPPPPSHDPDLFDNLVEALHAGDETTVTALWPRLDSTALDSEDLQHFERAVSVYKERQPRAEKQGLPDRPNTPASSPGIPNPGLSIAIPDPDDESDDPTTPPQTDTRPFDRFLQALHDGDKATAAALRPQLDFTTLDREDLRHLDIATSAYNERQPDLGKEADEAIRVLTGQFENLKSQLENIHDDDAFGQYGASNAGAFATIRQAIDTLQTVYDNRQEAAGAKAAGELYGEEITDLLGKAHDVGFGLPPDVRAALNTLAQPFVPARNLLPTTDW